MEPECSLSCSQQPATGPYPEPDESTPHLPTLFGVIPSLRVFREKSCMLTYLSPACYMLRPSNFLFDQTPY
jgi:hypothetical protein